MDIEDYRKKRDFRRTPEPPGEGKTQGEALRFVVQKHAASHLHYDFRLELDGVLKSWAVPKGPSLDPSVKRLAMMVEDHPVEYRQFEGVIPKGNYGAGRVIVWDEGFYSPYEPSDRKTAEKTLREGLRNGDLKFILAGQKLKGKFALVRIRSSEENSWLLIKKHDEFSTSEEITTAERSVATGRTLDELVDGNGAKATVGNSADDLDSAPAGAMPHAVKPMLATLVNEPFDDEQWIFEIKQDGYRVLAEVSGSRVLLYSRNNLSFNLKFPSIAAALDGSDIEAVFDGEVVVLDEKGRSSFQLLQNYNQTGQGEIYYFVFDILYFNGRDLRGLPLLKRKEILRTALPSHPLIIFNDHIAESGKAFFKLAQENKLEGIVAKLATSRYQAGRRSRDWLKIKTGLQQEALICGFTAPKGSRKQFGALVLGAYDRGKLIYIGRSGGGFDEKTIVTIHEMLLPLVRPSSPFGGTIPEESAVTWVEPVIVCEVAFSEWTDEGLMRHPVFLGLREDKEPASVIKETAAEEITPSPQTNDGRRTAVEEIVINRKKLKLTNLDKVFWPEEGYTKGDVIDYYRQVSPLLLPHLKDRPESLYRTPNGIDKEGFFQKEIGEYVPDWATTHYIFSESNDKSIKYFICQDEAALVYLANLGCIEINPWLSRIQHLDFPDYFVIDLDPEDIAFEKVIEAAQAVHEVMQHGGMPSFPKTSGATGMHIYVPLGARYDFEMATAFARVIATIAHNLAPDFTSIVRSPSRRQKKVYLDFLQNRKGQTLAAPYSIRPRKGATVSTPLRWDEVRHGLDPLDFTIRTIPQRLKRMGDLFSGVFGAGIDMEECLEKLRAFHPAPR